MANLEGGNFNKFLVVNRKFIQFLSITDQLRLSDMMRKLNKRIPTSSKNNKYIVINQDEPYAKEIIEILKRNGHWG